MSALVRVAVPVHQTDVMAGLIQSAGIALREGFERVARSCESQHAIIDKAGRKHADLVRAMTPEPRKGTWSCEVVFTWTEVIA